MLRTVIQEWDEEHSTTGAPQTTACAAVLSGHAFGSWLIIPLTRPQPRGRVR
ncbi:hypothetical protein [Streptomyces sp. NRRL S-1824]|uniref:hypothetical protein n=1 Tax=Streptomyces sp. NRRL S-1824 TaxID=1463889 RepID=UPI000ADC99FC|nr:hypothetical protein [Streptomyces sp. NRRL S-1824]